MPARAHRRDQVHRRAPARPGHEPKDGQGQQACQPQEEIRRQRPRPQMLGQKGIEGGIIADLEQNRRRLGQGSGPFAQDAQIAAPAVKEGRERQSGG